MKRRLKVIVPIVVLSIAMSGCTKMIVSMMGFKYSENRPLITSEADFDKHMQRLKRINGQEVKDELGSHYNKLYKNNTIYGNFYVPKEYESTKQLMVSGRGLVEPLFALNDKGVLIYNEKATKLYHATFSKHLNLLPISDTTKLAQQIIKHLNSTAQKKFDSLHPTKRYQSQVLEIGQSISRATASVDEGMQGDFTAHNQDFFKNVLSNYKFDVYISTSEMFMNNYISYQNENLNNAYINSYGDQNQLESQTTRLRNYHRFIENSKDYSKTTNIMIFPAEMLKNIKIAGAFKHVVTISIVNIQEQKNMLIKQITSYQGGVGDALKVAFKKATHTHKNDLQQEYNYEAIAHKNALNDALKYYKNEDLALISLHMQELDLFLKDVKSTLKISTGIKSQKL